MSSTGINTNESSQQLTRTSGSPGPINAGAVSAQSTAQNTNQNAGMAIQTGVHQNIQTETERQQQTQQNLMNFYYSPVQEKSRELERQLIQGPPSHIKKRADRIRWQNSMQDQIAEARAKEKNQRQAQRVFMNVSGSLVEFMSEKLTEMKNDYTVAGITISFGEVMQRVPELDPAKIVKEAKSEESQNITVLSDMLIRLRGMRAADLTADEAAGMVKEYKKLNLTIQPAAASRLDEVVSDPEACHLFLIHCTSTALCTIANTKSRDQVEEAQFAMLSGIASASAVAVGTMYNCEDLKRRTLQHQVEEVPAVHEIKEVNETNRAYLRTGIGIGASVPEEWPLKEYADLAEQLLGEKLETMTLEEVARAAQRMEEKLEVNLPAIRLLVASRKDLTQSIPTLEEALIRKTAQLLGTDLLSVDMSTDEALLKQKIEAASGDLTEETERIRTRLEQAAVKSGLSQILPFLSYGKMEKIVGSDDDEAFAERLNELAEQVETNLAQAKMMIEKKVSPLNRRRALDSLIALEADVLMTAAPAAVALLTEHFLQYINQYSPGTAERESNLKKVLKMAGLTPDLAGPACARIRRGNYPTLLAMVEAVKDIEKDVERNKTDFDAAVGAIKLSGSQWRSLHEWKEANLDLREKEGFRTKLEELLKAPEYAEQEHGTTADQYKREQQAENIQMRISPQERYTNLLKGEALCTWDGFAGSFAGLEETMMQAVEEMLQRGAKLAGFEHVHGTKDLGNVSYSDFQNFARILRRRLLACTDQWRAVRGQVGFHEKLQVKALRGIFDGTVTAETLQNHVSDEVERKRILDETNPLRFQALLGGADDGQIQLEYKYTDTEARSTREGDSRPEARIRRFNNARIVWNAVRAFGKESELIGWLHEGKKSSAIKSELKKILPKDSEAYRLMDSARETNPVYELHLMGMEGVLLSSGAEAHSFTSDKNTKYVDTLKAISKWYQPRIFELDQKIEALFADKNAAEPQTLRIRMTRIAAMLEPHGEGATTEEMMERNRQTCGVSQWSEALAEFERLAKLDRQNQEWTEIREHAEQKKKMVETLSQRHGGIYRNLAARIVETPEAWRVLTSGNTEQMNTYLSWLDEQIREPMEELGLFHQPYVEAQILKEKDPELAGSVADQILSGVTRSAWDWVQIFRTCYSAITQYTYKSRQAEQKFMELLNQKEYEVLAPYLNEVVTMFDKGVLALVDEKKVKPQLDAFRDHVTANKKVLDDYVKNVRLSENMGKELYQYLAPRILEASEDEFREKMEKWILEYQHAAAQMVEEVRITRTTFDEKRKKMEAISGQKAKRQVQDQEDTEVLNTLRRNLHTTASPLFTALGGQTLPDAKRVKAVRAELDKRYHERLLPQAVMDCLLERSLTKKKTPDAKELEPEVDWLSKTYEKILTTKFYDDTNIRGNLAQEVLMSVYIRHQDHMDKVPTEDELKSVLQTMTERYDKLEVLNHFSSEDPMLRMECMDLLECMRSAIHTMEAGKFEALLERRLNYLRTMSEASKRFGELLKRYDLKETEQIRVHRGLMQYYREALTDEQNPVNLDQIAAKAARLLEDSDNRIYLADSTSLLGGAAYDDLTEEELIRGGLEDRKSLEAVISGSGNEKLINAYNQLDVEQRQLFAMALENPAFIGNEELLPSARLAVNQMAATAQMQRARTAIASYIERDAFVPQVNYARAIHRLIGADGLVNAAAFAGAVRFVHDCFRARLAATPTEWNRLADSEESIQAVHRLAVSEEERKKAVIPEPVENTEQLIKQLNQELEGTKNTRSQRAALKKFTAMDPMRMQLVILALQNRTMLDESTIPGMEGFANEEMRDDFVSQCLDDRSSILEYPLDQDLLSQALKTLHSFQIRNDVDLGGRELRKDDFVKESLNRSSAVDWELLDRAMKLADQIIQDRLRKNAFRMAPEMIEKSENQKAIREYEKQKQYAEQKERPHNAEEFDAFLQEQAVADGKMALLAGYLSLSEREKKLFVKALGKREILDISKIGIRANRWGKGERDYADPEGRYELLDEYLEYSRGQGGGVVLTEDAYSRAITSALSTQMRDDIDFTTQEELQDALTNKGLFHSTRKTAVDWKLVSRALQLVHRTSNERDIFVEDRELYVSQMDISRMGRFTFDSAYMRQNIHNAGNRFTRFFGRRVRSTVEDYVSAPSKYIKVPLLNPIDSDGAWHDKINDAVGLFSDFYQESYGKEIVAAAGGNALADRLEEHFGTIGDHLGYVNAGIHIATDIYTHIQLVRAKSQAKAERAGDEAQLQRAAENQTQEQQKLSRNADQRNENVLELGVSKAHERKNDDLVQTVASVAGGLISDAVGDEFGIIEKICEEAGEFVNFLRNYFNDVSSVKKYYEKRGEAQALRGILMPQAQAGALEKLSDIDLIRDARGFENYTEMATFVGLNITRSLLFCAGPYNPQKRLRILAIAVLSAVGMKEAIGLQDSKTAQSVYDALMGGDYR